MKQNPYIVLLKISWHFASGLRARYVLTYVLFVVSNVAVAINPWVYGWFMDRLQSGSGDVLSVAWLYAGAFLGLFFLQWLCHGPARIMERKLALFMSKNYLDEHFRKALYLPVEWHQQNHTGITVDRLRKSYLALRTFFQYGFSYITILILCIVSFSAIIISAPLYGIIGLLMGCFTIAIVFLFDRFHIQSLKEINEYEHAVSARLTDSLSNILTVSMLRLEPVMRKELISKIDKIEDPFHKSTKVGETKWFLANLFLNVSYCIVVIGYVYSHYQPGQVFLIGGLVTTIGFVNQFNVAFFNIATQYSQIVQYYSDLQATDVINTMYGSGNSRKAKEYTSSDWNTITVSDLNFTFHQGLQCDNLAFNGNFAAHGGTFKGLHNINLNFARKKRIAVIGESGSGKSTLFAVLRGIRTSSAETQIIVDDRSTIDKDELAANITLLPQEPEIFENTIAYNLTLGLPYLQHEIDAACARACFTEVVESMPQRFNTLITERGSNLSGGQRQRLALARGILASKNSNIILLDEATNRVDSATEQKIYNNLFDLFADKVLVCSIHNLNLLSYFDYVYVMKSGRIIEEGAPDTIVYNGQMIINSRT
jgi:ATP-binding cassette, subfamily B, bacterial